MAVGRVFFGVDWSSSPDN